jgi:hypothetical protein
MKKNGLVWVAVLVCIAALLTGCEKILRSLGTPISDAGTEQTAGVSPDGTTVPVVPEAGNTGEKVVKYELKNVSGTSYLLDSEVAPYELPDAYGITDFTVKAGDSEKSRVSDPEELLSSGQLVETSATTYEIVITFVWAEIPTDEDELDMNQTEGPFYTQDITLTGTYGEYAVIEWDGSSFRQVG